MKRCANRVHIHSLSLQDSDTDVINIILRMARSSVKTLDIAIMCTNETTLDILSKPFDSLHTLELSFLNWEPISSPRAVTQASSILDRLSRYPGIVGSSRREYIITLHSTLIPDDATIEACSHLEQLILQCPHHILFKYPGQRTRWLFWDPTMSTLFPVLHTNNMLNLESCARVDVKRPLPRYSHYASMTALAATRDGRWIASGSWDGSIILWSMVKHDISPVLDWGAHSEQIKQLQFSPDGQFLASSSESEIRIWHTMRGTQLATLEHNAHPESHPTGSPLHPSMIWSPVGTIIGCSVDRLVQWWDTNTFLDSASDQPSLVGGLQSSNSTTPSSTVFPPKGSCSLTIPAAHDHISDPIRHHYSLFDSVFSSDGDRFITTYELNGSVMTQIWDISELENILPFHELSLSTDQKQPGSTVNSFHLSVKTSGSGREVLVRKCEDRLVEIWDTHADTCIASLEHDHKVTAAHISRCGKFVATATYLPHEDMIYLWRVSDGACKCLESFKVKGDVVDEVLLAPDGQTLVYGINGTDCRPIGHLLME